MKIVSKKLMSDKEVRTKYQKHFAKMVFSFFMQTIDRDEDEIKRVYESFAKNWSEIVTKVNNQQGRFILSYDAWDKEFKRDGYKKLITKPIPVDAKEKLIRIIYIVEGKTEKQRARRETYYKAIFVFVRIKVFFKNLFKSEKKKKEEELAKNVRAHKQKMSAVPGL